MKFLKKKKKLEGEVVKKEVAVDQLNDMIEMIQNTESQKEVNKFNYQTGSLTLWPRIRLYCTNGCVNT